MVTYLPPEQNFFNTNRVSFNCLLVTSPIVLSMPPTAVVWGLSLPNTGTMERLTNVKIPLPEFLKVLSSNGIPVKKAMEMTGKVFVELFLLQVVVPIHGDFDPVTRPAVPLPHWHC